MPPKKRSSDDSTALPTKKKPKKDAPPKAKGGGPKLPPTLPVGEILTDYTKTQWKIGGSVGQGGFGQIYLASEHKPKKATPSAHYVIKVEPYANGPLFSELSFYRRIAKPEHIQAYAKGSKLSYLPIPKFIGAGEHEWGAVKYRFMVMERFGEDIEKIFCQANRKFNLKTVCYLGLRMIEALEYLHDNEYVHADIKGSNILTGYSPSDIHKVYLVDYGLAYRYMNEGVHREYKPDPRRCHDGTIEFTSIDAHDGANPSRRGDMEILGYCMIQWASGTLPWMGYLENKSKVASEKKKYKTDVSGLLKACFKDGSVPSYLKQYMTSVYKCEYDETPDYISMKGFLKTALDKDGSKDDKNGLEWIPGKSKAKKAVEDKKEVEVSSPPRRKSKRIASQSPYSPIKRISSESIDEEEEYMPPKKAKKSPNDAPILIDSPKKKGSSNNKKKVSPHSPIKRISSESTDGEEEYMPPSVSRAKKAKKSPNDALILIDSPKKKGSLNNKKKGTSPKKVSQAARKGRARVAKVTNIQSQVINDDENHLPLVYYPTSLGYGKENGAKETFGSLAEKKKKRK